MEQRISLVTLGVGDIARARTFYERLGWEASGPSSPQVVFFQLNGMALGLWTRNQLADDARRNNDGQGFDGVTLAYNVRKKSDVEKVLSEALRAGGKILKHGQDVFWGGHSGYFEDPDGHCWEVAWNPFFPLDQKGQVSIDAKRRTAAAVRKNTRSKPAKARPKVARSKSKARPKRRR